MGIKKRKPSAKSRKTRLDALCRLAVLTRDKGRCLKCGKGLAQWCHVYSRRYLSLRWDTGNSLALCAAHHWWWHDQPLEAANWWESEVAPKIGTSREELSARLRLGNKPDFDEIENVLNAVLRFYQTGQRLEDIATS